MKASQIKKLLYFLASLATIYSIHPARGEQSLNKATYDEIRDKYLFIADFTLKPDIRQVHKEIFWRYQVKIPEKQFKIDWGYENNKDISTDFPATPGEGRATEHINRGRFLFLNDQPKLAKNALLGARARFGSNYEYHRRLDYFLGNAFLRQAELKSKALGGIVKDKLIKPDLGNAATFLSWAFLKKRDIPDPIVNKVTPRNLYNLAIIYYTFGRFSGSFEAASVGLNFLNRTGRTDYRFRLRNLIAELLMKNQDYIGAVKQFDTILRQDINPRVAGLTFARVADIYFDLNNFELAEDLYGIANRLDRFQKIIEPYQFILRGESLFWLGKSDKALKMFNYGLNAQGMRGVRKPLSQDMAALASLRIADTYLTMKKNNKAKIAYFRHSQEFANHKTAMFAKLRLACLQLPSFRKNNIRHGRKLLSELKSQIDLLPAQAQELAWACETASHAQHERTPGMVERVGAFLAKYPESSFLKGFVKPVQNVQRKKLYEYLQKENFHAAIDFYEKTKSLLFTKISRKLESQLYKAYIEINESENAVPFWNPQKNWGSLNTRDIFREAVFLAEMLEKDPTSRWLKANTEFIDAMKNREFRGKLSPEISFFLDRILATQSSYLHTPWLLTPAEHWVKKDFIIMCDIVYPLFSGARRASSANLFLDQIQPNRIKNLIDENLSQVLQFETNCGYSLLELEAQIYKDTQEIYADKLIARKYLPLTQQTAKYFWQLAEDLRSKNSLTKAKTLWKHIVEQGSSDLKEVRYAKRRLTPFQTQLEKLWQ